MLYEQYLLRLTCIFMIITISTIETLPLIKYKSIAMTPQGQNTFGDGKNTYISELKSDDNLLNMRMFPNDLRAKGRPILEMRAEPGDETTTDSPPEGENKEIPSESQDESFPLNDLAQPGLFKFDPNTAPAEVCYDKSTGYTANFPYLTRRVYMYDYYQHYNKGNSYEWYFRPVWHTLRYEIFRKGKSEECYNAKEYETWKPFVECSVKRNMRMEFYVPMYPRTQYGYLHGFNEEKRIIGSEKKFTKDK